MNGPDLMRRRMRTPVGCWARWFQCAFLFAVSCIGWCSIARGANFFQPLAFTGRDHVDLAWDHPGTYAHYKVLRDGVQVGPTLGPDTTFYRDTGLSEGEAHSYQVCAFNDGGSDYCGFAQSATAGQISGTIHQDLAWGSGTYTLASHVQVASNATLTIGPGATVQDDGYPWGISISDAAGGEIRITGGTFHTKLEMHQAASSIAGGTLGLGSGLTLASDEANLTLTGLIVTNSGISIAGAGIYRVMDNDFRNATLSARLAAHPDITQNRFTTEASVFVSDDANPTITDNTFDNSYLHLQSTSAVTVQRNHFTLSLHNRQALSVAVTCPAVVEENILETTAGADQRPGTGIIISGTDTPSVVTVRRNVIMGFDRGFHLAGCRADILDNDILGNRIGVYCHGDADVRINDNCITGNGEAFPSVNYGGLTVVDRATALDAGENYWGDPSGPTHPDHPTGTGDAIKELDANLDPDPGWVNFSGFLTSGNCASVVLPPNLRVAAASMDQVIEGVEELIEAKPLAVKVVVASDRITSPFRVRLTYGGADYEAFYEKTPDNLDVQMQLRQSATHLEFNQAGEKTIYFFPPNAPFGDRATATVRLDPDLVHQDPDPSNNTKTWEQPVVKTRWARRPSAAFAHILRPAVIFADRPVDLGWLQNLARVMDTAPSFLPIAPLDYQWSYLFAPEEKNPPAQPSSTRGYRAGKSALPAANKIVLIAHKPYARAAPETYVWDNGSGVTLVFIEGEAEPPHTFGAGISSVLQTYRLPASKNAVPVLRGIDVGRRRLMDDQLARDVAGKRV